MEVTGTLEESDSVSWSWTKTKKEGIVFFPRLYIGCLKIREKSLWRKETIKRNTCEETLKITIPAKKKKKLGVILVRKRKNWVKDRDCTGCSQRSFSCRRTWMWTVQLTPWLDSCFPGQNASSTSCPTTQLRAMINWAFTMCKGKIPSCSLHSIHSHCSPQLCKVPSLV